MKTCWDFSVPIDFVISGAHLYRRYASILSLISWFNWSTLNPSSLLSKTLNYKSEKEKGFENLQSITLYLPTHSPSSLLFKSRSFCHTYPYKKPQIRTSEASQFLNLCWAKLLRGITTIHYQGLTSYTARLIAGKEDRIIRNFFYTQ